MDKDSKLSPSKKNEFPIIMALFVMFFTLIMWMGFGILFASAVEKLPFEKYGLSGVERYLVVHTPYLLMFISLFFGCNLLLKTDLRILISGNDKKYRYKLSLLFGGIYLVCLAILSLLSIKTIELDPASFGEKIKYLIPVLIFTPMQAISEEVFYRALPARMVFKDRMPTKRYEIIALSIFSGLFFITPHLKNPEVIQNIEYLSALSYYFVWGALSMALGIYTGGFEIPVAMHIVNNIYIALIVNYEGGAMPTHALFINRSTTPSNWIMVLEALVIFAILFIAAGIQKKKEKKGN
jgi:membrane protease YdiL (CAAX protease family)